MNARRIPFLCLIALALAGGPLYGQSWTKLKKEGDEFAKNGLYFEAAESYYKAWKSKPEKLILAWQSGNWFGLVKEYGRAAESLEPVAHWNEPEKKAGLLYARALKQNGRYEEAIEAYESFLAAYQGPDRAVVETLTLTEIEGCRMGQSRPGSPSPYSVSWPGKSINSEGLEFAPALFGTDVVYFSSTRSGMARLYRSQYQNEKWGKADAPSSLPADPANHVANGSFSRDGQRFYYTVCSQPSDARKQRARCDIHMMTRRGSGWTAGEKLPAYINLADATTTHPATATIEGLEYLFFTSDRPGGQGGMDLWYVTRQAGSVTMDFSFPQNAGALVNTPADEWTPFYDEKDKALYFSSNGHISFGGFDIFRVNGQPGSWSRAENLGRPINSEADDTYFALSATGEIGFLSSNRPVKGQKNHTRDEDLFFVSTQPVEMLVKGKVFDRMSQDLIPGSRVFAYHVNNGDKVVFTTQFAEDGNFTLRIPQGREIWVTAEKSEYEPSILRVDPDKDQGPQLTHNFYLIPETMPDEEPVVAAPVAQAPQPVEKAPEIPAMEPSVAKTADPDPVLAVEEAPRNVPPAPSPQPDPAMPDKEPQPEKQPAEEIAQRTEDKGGLSLRDRLAREGLTPYRNRVRLPEKTGEESVMASRETPPSGQASMPAPEETVPAAKPVVTPPPTQPEPANVIAAARPPAPDFRDIHPSSVGTSAPLAEDDLFSGKGLDRRYNGKRVDKRKYLTEAESHEGIYYRIQLEATDRPVTDGERYEIVADLGQLETESLPNLGLYRVLTGIYRDLPEALDAQRAARKAGFSKAFVVRYEDGIRLRRWK